MNITAPIIHLNGTDGRQLLAGYERAHQKLEEFIEAWGKIEFNERDYYPLGDKVLRDAIIDRGIVNASVTIVRNYLMAHMLAIRDQVTERELVKPTETHPAAPQAEDNAQPAIPTPPSGSPA